jgi:hypothetical protein
MVESELVLKPDATIYNNVTSYFRNALIHEPVLWKTAERRMIPPVIYRPAYFEPTLGGFFVNICPAIRHDFLQGESGEVREQQLIL